MTLFFEVLSCVSFLFWFLSLWIASKYLLLIRTYVEKVDAMELTLPIKKHAELDVMFSALKTEFDTLLMGNDQFREQTYRQIQRFDTIMRRNERAVKAVDDETDEDAPLPQVGAERVAEEFTTTAVIPPSDESPISKQRRLRKLWEDNRKG